MNISKWILDKCGWKFVVNVPIAPKCVICVAPHTSNWDFILGELAIRSVGKSAGFLMKSTWFFPPLGFFMKKIGGIPVVQKRHTHVTDTVVEAFNHANEMAVAVTPEGTRSPNPNWHKGFLYIAHAAAVPVLLAYLDYGSKTICIDREFKPTGDPEADLMELKKYYKDKVARYPQKFVTGL
jgi:1-acyl-sn-glycerol-3-phosphate acyltransferase